MISVCIPTYEQNGSGGKYLALLLESLEAQEGVRFDVIVSDNSAGLALRDLCRAFSSRLTIRYLRNSVLGVSNNSNHAIAHATYDFIKIMYQDDLLIDPCALAIFADALKRKSWVVSSFRRMNERRPYGKVKHPVWPPNILCDKNTLGMPSIMAMRRDPEIQFDPNLKVRLDCEYYWLYDQKYGQPEYIESPLVGCRYWDGSISRVQGNHNFVEAESAYLLKKHGFESSAPVLTEFDRYMNRIAKTDICTDKSGKIVPCGDAQAAFVLVGKGREISQKLIDKHGEEAFGSAKDNPGPETHNHTVATAKIARRRKRIIKPTGIHHIH